MVVHQQKDNYEIINNKKTDKNYGHLMTLYHLKSFDLLKGKQKVSAILFYMRASNE